MEGMHSGGGTHWRLSRPCVALHQNIASVSSLASGRIVRPTQRRVIVLLAEQSSSCVIED